MEVAYFLEEKHFMVEEVNFKLLKEHTNNVILEYKPNNKYFKRALFEMDRLGFNIGIYVPYSIDYVLNFYVVTQLAISDTRGFNIKLGLWIDDSMEYNTMRIANILKSTYSNNFIVGIRNSNVYNYTWSYYGDIQDNNDITLDFIREPIRTLKLYTDFVRIYDENNLKPVPSNYKTKEVPSTI